MAFVKTAAFKACMTVLFSSSLKHKHHLYWLDAVFSAIPYGISLWTVGIFQSPFYGIYFIIICLRAVNLRRFDGISGTSSYTWGFACNFSSPWYFSVISFQVQGIRQPQLDCVNYFPFFKNQRSCFLCKEVCTQIHEGETFPAVTIQSIHGGGSLDGPITTATLSRKFQGASRSHWFQSMVAKSAVIWFQSGRRALTR